MSEIVNTYLLSDPETAIPMDRDEFYAEQIDSFERLGKPTRAVETINIFIFNHSGELLIQKRSYDKAHNPGLLDKSVGGHILHGDTADFSVMVETVQELQTPTVVLKDDFDFEKALKVLGGYTTTVGIVKHLKTQFYFLEKIFNGKSVTIANKAHIYLGVYDGSTRVVDREAKGILFYTLEELKKEISEIPKAFTSDIKMFMEELGPEMEKFLAYLDSERISK